MLNILSILKSDNTYTTLEHLNVSDNIIGWGGIINTVISKDVIDVHQHDIYKEELIDDNKIHVYLLNDIPVCLTMFQPIMTIEGWKSISPVKTLQYQPEFGLISKLQIGDILFMYDEKHQNYKCVELTKIKHKQLNITSENVCLFNINILGNHSYHINGLVIHCLNSCDHQQQILIDKIKQLTPIEVQKLKQFFVSNFKEMESIMGMKSVNTIATQLGIKVD
jgi:hypothetical protein